MKYKQKNKILLENNVIVSKDKILNFRVLQKNIFFSKRFIYNKINQEKPLFYNRKSHIFPNYFANADSNFADSDFVIFGVPYDKTSTFRKGSRYGPMDIRQASWNYEEYNMFNGKNIQSIKFCDYGDLDIKNERPEKMVQKVKNFTNKILNKKKFPIILGGEHSLTSGSTCAYRFEDIAVLYLDAHLDYRDKHQNEKYNHACTLRRITDQIKVENIAVLGIRSAEKKEFYKAKKEKLFYKTSYDFKTEGIEKILKQTRDHLERKKVYLTLDMDVIDPSFVPGVSTPEPFGITPFDVIQILDCFSNQLIGFDVVETCPPFDNGEGALHAAKFVRFIMEKSVINNTNI